MLKIDSVLAMRTNAAEILTGVTKRCIETDPTQVDGKWLGQQILYFSDYNFLTLHEINRLFGWNDAGLAEKYCELVTKPRFPQSLPQLSGRELQQRVMAMVGVVAAKYRLYCLFSPEVAELNEVGESAASQRLEVTSRYELLFRPLSNFPKFEAMGARARKTLKDEGISFIGDLLNLEESDLLRIPNFGRKSLNEIKEAMTYLPQWATFGCLLDNEKTEFGLRRWFNVTKYRKLNVKDTDWVAPSELVESLEKLGITLMTQLASCPQEVLEQFAVWQSDLERMVDVDYIVDSVGNNLFLPVPENLLPDVKVYAQIHLEKFTTVPE